jgi:hypothetical protein
MVDPFGAATSGLAVAEAAAKLTKTTAELYSQLRDAPFELSNAKLSLHSLTLLLEEVRKLKDDAQSSHPSESPQVVKVILDATEKAIIRFQTLCVKLPTKTTGFRTGVKWVLRRKHSLASAELELAACERRLGTFVNLWIL